MKNKFIAIRNQTDNSTLELFFLDVIQDSFDWFTGMEMSKVQEIIDKVNNAQPRVIKLLIDSEGGDAQTGISIYNFLKRTGARVEVEVIGLAGSIASVIAMAANPGKLKIARNGFMMIHRAQGIAIGTGDELRSSAAVVDKYDDQIADIYSQRTNKPVDEIRALYANGDFWMSGQEAVDQGFADATFNDVTNNLNIAARLDLDIYKNLPAAVRAQLGTTGTEGHMDPRGEPGEEGKTFLQIQLDEMKNLITAILNSIRGVKPEEGKPLPEQIASAMTEPMQNFANEIETTISSQVDTAITSQAVIDKIKAALPPPPAPVPVDLTQVSALLTSEGDNAFKTFVTNAIENALKPLRDENTALKNDVLLLKGKTSNSGHTGSSGAAGFEPKGKFVKG